jgi:hypothetical protein
MNSLGIVVIGTEALEAAQAVADEPAGEALELGIPHAQRVGVGEHRGPAALGDECDRVLGTQ